MKKIAVLAALVFSTLSIKAQVVRVGLMGVGAGTGQLQLHALDVSYAPQAKFDVGAYFGLGIGGSETEASAGTRFGLQSKYYFLTGKFKPFAGVQLGLNTGASIEVNNAAPTTESVKAGTKFQAVPQLGFRLGPINLWASYQNGVMFNGGLVFGFGGFDD
jgi:hypothetical protein